MIFVVVVVAFVFASHRGEADAVGTQRITWSRKSHSHILLLCLRSSFNRNKPNPSHLRKWFAWLCKREQTSQAKTSRTIVHLHDDHDQDKKVFHDSFDASTPTTVRLPAMHPNPIFNLTFQMPPPLAFVRCQPPTTCLVLAVGTGTELDSIQHSQPKLGWHRTALV